MRIGGFNIGIPERAKELAKTLWSKVHKSEEHKNRSVNTSPKSMVSPPNNCRLTDFESNLLTAKLMIHAHEDGVYKNKVGYFYEKNYKPTVERNVGEIRQPQKIINQNDNNK